MGPPLVVALMVFRGYVLVPAVATGAVQLNLPQTYWRRLAPHALHLYIPRVYACSNHAEGDLVGWKKVYVDVLPLHALDALCNDSKQ